MPVVQNDVVEVSGAGLSQANGMYVRSVDCENAPAYTRNTPDGDFLVCKKNGKWAVCNPSGTRLYITNDEFILPLPSVGGWTQLWGPSKSPLPAPKVTLHSGVGKRNHRHLVKVQERVWKRKKFTDAVVVCDGVRFNVHRSTLSAASPVFEVAFDTPMQEGATTVYEIKDATASAVECLLSFLYTGSTDVPEVERIQLLHLAVQYEIDELIEFVAWELLGGLTVENVQDCVRALKVHQVKVQAQWKDMLQKLRDEPTLLAAALPP